MAFKAIKNEIASILAGLTGEGLPLAISFSYFEPQPNAFPCAMVRALGASSDTRLDSASNMLTMRFTIRIISRTANTEEGDDDMLDALEAVLDALRSQQNVDTLGGSVEKFDVEGIEPFEDQTDQAVTGFDITVAAGKIATIS